MPFFLVFSPFPKREALWTVSYMCCYHFILSGKSESFETFWNHNCYSFSKSFNIKYWQFYYSFQSWDLQLYIFPKTNITQFIWCSGPALRLGGTCWVCSPFSLSAPAKPSIVGWFRQQPHWPPESYRGWWRGGGHDWCDLSGPQPSSVFPLRTWDISRS